MICSSRYILWYRLPCQQPEQPIQSTCTEDPPREPVNENIPANQLTYVWVGSGSSDPNPYSSYQFQIEAENSAGRSDPSPFSSDVQTPTTGKHTYIHTYIHTVYVLYFIVLHIS